MSQPLSRDVPLELAQAALLIIDMQNFSASTDGSEFKAKTSAQMATYNYYFKRLKTTTIPTIQALQQACRNASIEVMYCVIESLTQDGRDRSLDYKITGFNVPKNSWDAQVIDAIAPQGDEIVIAKTSSSVFISTNIHYVLGNLGVRYLVICGALTDQCVESAVRDACDLGYLVTLVPDACATYSEDRQQSTLRAIKGYCRQCDSATLIAEIERLQQGRAT